MAQQSPDAAIQCNVVMEPSPADPYVLQMPRGVISQPPASLTMEAIADLVALMCAERYRNVFAPTYTLGFVRGVPP